MKKKLVYSFLYGIASLPFPILYLLSDLLFVIGFHILKYRRKIVRDNLANAFPNMNKVDRLKLERQFFRDLSDLVLETIKLLKISKETLLKRCTVPDTIGNMRYFSSQTENIILTAHYGNWEWAAPSVGIRAFKHPVQVVFLRLKNGLFNEVMKKIRTRFGNDVVHMEMALRRIMELRGSGVTTCFLADQTPQLHQAGIWTNFLNREAPFFTGPEKIARKLNQEVFFGKIIKVKRGRYRVELELITDKPSEMKPGEITELYVKKLEKAIMEQPSTWLWSHRRWKHIKPVS